MSRYKKNRKVVRRLIDVVIFLTTQELTFRGHLEDETSANRGNDIELISLLRKYDETLDIQLHGVVKA